MTNLSTFYQDAEGAHMSSVTLPPALPRDLPERIQAMHTESGVPLSSFLDSRPADLDDLAAELGASISEVLAAQRALAELHRPPGRSPVIGHAVVNLHRERIAEILPSYSEALTAAAEYERMTGQPHGIQRAAR